MFGGGADVALGGVRDDDTVVGGGVDVDVVDADAGPADDDEFGGGLEQRPRDVRAGADDERIGVGNGVEQCLALDVVGCLDLVARFAEAFESGVRDGVRDEYLHTGSDFLGGHNACFLVACGRDPNRRQARDERRGNRRSVDLATGIRDAGTTRYDRSSGLIRCRYLSRTVDSVSTTGSKPTLTARPGARPPLRVEV